MRTGRRFRKDADSVDEKEILGLVEKLNEGEGEGDMNALTEKAREQLSIEWRYEIQHSGSTQESFVDSCKLDVSPVKAEREIDPSSTESIVKQLQEHLDRIHESVISVHGTNLPRYATGGGRKQRK